MDLNFDNVVIEVTRKCNMQCEHCLRGSAQRKVIPNSYIYKFMGLIDNIATLTITGGEPTLAMESLEYIRECAVYGRADVGSFYMVTNGKSINVETLANWIYRMYNACHDNDLSSVSFSFDRFHNSMLNWNQMQKKERNYRNLLEKMEYEYGFGGRHYPLIGKHTDDKFDYNNLITEGRAEEFGVRSNDITSFEEDNWGDNIQFTETELYLSCSGYIVAGCDWSYKSIDNKKDIRICHIDDINCQEDLIEAIRNYNKKVQECKELV